MKVVQVSVDGNCLFRGIAYHLHEGDDSYYDDVRQQIVDYMSEEDKGFRVYFEDAEEF